ncbi:hypothetical protein KFL_002060230 [Klebsormidium nitens]|uniref:Alpha-ketoglutarate-dependent dioxygenase AlkB-like domain-containing protein n=1 Tax=Klebsormidium nitens TaxID=105231 RepID=A0A1Y1I4B9_KLENI|nr:hypothetical protein KFL_002060230 [Klebsormidium nitens]|eukprot:GAQ84802.1 hypothetical protein KFL_002060230 [Klebsormidium nitens]
MQAAGHPGQPPLKRLKTAKTLFDYGVKRNAVNQGRAKSDPNQVGFLPVRSQVNDWLVGSDEIKPHVSSTSHNAANVSPYLAETSNKSFCLEKEQPEADSIAVSTIGSPAPQVLATARFALTQGTSLRSIRAQGSEWQKQAFNAFRQEVESGSPLPPSSKTESSSNNRKNQGYSSVATHAPHTSGSPLVSSPSGLLSSLSAPVSATLPRPFRPERKNVPSVPGLEYSLDFVSKDEERQIIRLLDSGKFRWRTDIARRTLHFGHNYVYSKRTGEKNTAAPPIPEELAFLTERMVAAGVYSREEAPTVLIVNEYLEDQGIAAHVDKFEFSNTVVSISLNSACWMRFHELDLPPGVLPF